MFSTGRARSISGGSGQSGASHDSGFSRSSAESGKSSKDNSPLPRSRRRGHRRVHSEGSGAKKNRTSYLVRQSGENLYRRIKSLQLPLLQTHEHDGKRITHCVPGKKLVSWLIDQGDFTDRPSAESFLQAVVESGILVSVAPEQKFTDVRVTRRT